MKKCLYVIRTENIIQGTETLKNLQQKKVRSNNITYYI